MKAASAVIGTCILALMVPVVAAQAAATSPADTAFASVKPGDPADATIQSMEKCCSIRNIGGDEYAVTALGGRQLGTFTLEGKIVYSTSSPPVMLHEGTASEIVRIIVGKLLQNCADFDGSADTKQTPLTGGNANVFINSLMMPSGEPPSLQSGLYLMCSGYALSVNDVPHDGILLIESRTLKKPSAPASKPARPHSKQPATKIKGSGR